MRDLPPRRRAPAPAWTRPITERLTPTIKALVVVETLVYFFYVFVVCDFPKTAKKIEPGRLLKEDCQ